MLGCGFFAVSSSTFRIIQTLQFAAPFRRKFGAAVSQDDQIFGPFDTCCVVGKAVINLVNLTRNTASLMWQHSFQMISQRNSLRKRISRLQNRRSAQAMLRRSEQQLTKCVSIYTPSKKTQIFSLATFQDRAETEMSEDERIYWKMERYAKPWPPDWLPRMKVFLHATWVYARSGMTLPFVH